MAVIRAAVVDILQGRGLGPAAAEAVVARTWFIPDPVAAARPCADLPALFTRLRADGLRLAVATSDDRVPTLATLAGLGLAGLVDVVVCADDGLPIKPAPDMVLAACSALGTQPERAVVVGDALADMQMAKAAGALAVGVLTGVSGAEHLRPAADLILPGIDAL
jgi:phosphoglycolate phosphatase